MIELFVASWDLFHNTYLAGWGIALLLSLLGVFVVARDHIYLCSIPLALTNVKLLMNSEMGLFSSNYF